MEQIPSATEKIPLGLKEWLESSLSNYTELFDVTTDDLKDKKILEIGAFDRRLAIACKVLNISDDVYSLEPGLGDEEGESFAKKEQLLDLVEQLPLAMREEIDEKTMHATAEDIPVDSVTFDVIFSRSVPFSSVEELHKRVSELLRVSREVRIYPIKESNMSDVKEVLDSVSNELQIEYRFKTTLDTVINDDEEVKEDVLVINRLEN